MNKNKIDMVINSIIGIQSNQGKLIKVTINKENINNLTNVLNDRFKKKIYFIKEEFDNIIDKSCEITLNEKILKKGFKIHLWNSLTLEKDQLSFVEIYFYLENLKENINRGDKLSFIFL